MTEMHADKLRGTKHAQAAIDFLLTYGLAFLIIGVIIAVLYVVLLQVPSSIPSTCSFETGLECKAVIFGSNALNTTFTLLVSNNEPYSVMNPAANAIFDGAAHALACTPSFVLRGGTIVCNVTLAGTYTQGSLKSGSINIIVTPCQSDSASPCTLQKQNLTGTFSTQVQPKTLILSYSMNVIAENYTPSVNQKDLINATIYLEEGSTKYPISGATVNFTSNSVYATFSPQKSTSSASGVARTYVASSAAGNVLITAAFANTISANTVIGFSRH